MSQSILVTGGAASGKSRFAITHFAPYDYVLYLKIGKEPTHDLLRRIKYDNDKFGVSWDVVTWEVNTDGSCKTDNAGNPSRISDMVADHKFVVFDSVSAYTRLAISNSVNSEEQLTTQVKREIERDILDTVFAVRDKVKENRGAIIITTLETGFTISPESKGAAAYLEILGRVNQRIANTSDSVYFSASGIQFQIK